MNMRWYDDDFVAAFWISLGITFIAGMFMILVCVPKNTQEAQEVLNLVQTLRRSEVTGIIGIRSN